MKKTILAMLLAGSVAGAMAQTYAGVSLGMGSFKIDCSGTLGCTKSDLGGKVYGGYMLAPMVSAELGYVDFGSALTRSSSGGAMVSASVEAVAVTAALALRAEVMPAWTGVARLGVASVRSTRKNTVDATGVVYGEGSQMKTKPYLGLGLEYALTPQLKATLGADVTQATVDDSKGQVRLYSLGAQYAY